MQAALRPAYLWLRAATDPAAYEHLALLEAVPGLGAATRRKLERGLPLQLQDFFAQASEMELSAAARKRLNALQNALQTCRVRAAESGLAVALLESLEFLQIPADTRLLRLAGAFGHDLPAFAEHLASHAESTVYDPRAQAVALMTLHAAKGLEFPVVFIAGLEQGLLPLDLPGLPSPVEEERRLLYVGLTRARQRLILTCSGTRTLFGQAESRQPSPFLQELGIASQAAAERIKKTRGGGQMGLF
jgi:superfamily I DNA/RNA helicase